MEQPDPEDVPQVFQSDFSGQVFHEIDDGEIQIFFQGADMSVDFIFSKKTGSIWYFPVKTISQSERAYELNFQASCIIPRWQINLPSAKQTSFSLIWSF